MKRTIVVYSLAIAAIATALQWLEYRHAVRLLPTEFYAVVIALGFTALGLWTGNRLTAKHPAPEFEQNARAVDSLGVSERELEVLDLLAEGLSNRQIGERLFISPNTVKTHLSHLYDKLEVSRRTEAIHRARSLQLIP